MRYAFLILLSMCAFPRISHAVLPPDILFSVTSSVTQVIALVGITISTAWISFMTLFQARTTRFWIVQGLIVSSILALVVFGFDWNEQSEVTPSPQQVPAGVHPELSSMRLVLIGKNTADPLALELDLNIRQEARGFQYYHYGELVVNNHAYHAYSNGTDSALKITPRGFLTEFGIDGSPDLSARYTVHFTATIEGQQLDAHLENFNGDFLEKNTPLYFKEVSIGSGQLLINGAPVEVYAFASPVYSRDYTKYVYFDGFNDVRGIARQFIVFDEQGDTYVVDRSDVENPVPGYTSHQWVLFKAADGGSYKGFTADITSVGTGKNETAWTVTSHDIPFTLKLNSVQKYNGNLKGRTVRGTVERADGSSTPVVGIAHIEVL